MAGKFLAQAVSESGNALQGMKPDPAALRKRVTKLRGLRSPTRSLLGHWASDRSPIVHRCALYPCGQSRTCSLGWRRARLLRHAHGRSRRGAGDSDAPCSDSRRSGSGSLALATGRDSAIRPGSQLRLPRGPRAHLSGITAMPSWARRAFWSCRLLHSSQLHARVAIGRVRREALHLEVLHVDVTADPFTTRPASSARCGGRVGRSVHREERLARMQSALQAGSTSLASRMAGRPRKQEQPERKQQRRGRLGDREERGSLDVQDACQSEIALGGAEVVEQ